MLVTFSLSVDCKNIILPFSFLKQCEKCLCEYFMHFFHNFNYRCKIIIKGVGNIIEIGYSFTIMKGEYVWYTRRYTF